MKYLLIVIVFVSCNHAKPTIYHFNIVCDGNSLTYGYGLTDPLENSYPTQLKKDDRIDKETTAVYNLGVTGQNTSEMIIRGKTAVDNLIKPGAKNVVLAWEGTNEIYFKGVCSEAFEKFKSYCLERKAAGWKVVAITLLPRNQIPKYGGSFDDFNKKIDTVNLLLKKEWKNFSDALIDVRSNNSLNDAKNTEYFLDGVHLTEKGYRIIKDMAITSIVQLQFE